MEVNQEIIFSFMVSFCTILSSIKTFDLSITLLMRTQGEGHTLDFKQCGSWASPLCLQTLGP